MTEPYTCEECGREHLRKADGPGKRRVLCVSCAKRRQRASAKAAVARFNERKKHPRRHCWQCGPCVKVNERWFCSAGCEAEYTRYEAHLAAHGGFMSMGTGVELAEAI